MLLISKDVAADKLEKLLLLNQRLPMSEIERRVKLWRGNKKEDSLWRINTHNKKAPAFGDGRGCSKVSEFGQWDLMQIYLTVTNLFCKGMENTSCKQILFPKSAQV